MCYDSFRENLWLCQLQVERNLQAGEDWQSRTQYDRIDGQVVLINETCCYEALHKSCAASPLAWYIMHDWLQGFAYRTALGGWMFVVAGAAATGIALLTVGFQAMRAATANLVKSLRTE